MMRVGNGSKCCHGKGLKTVSIAPHYTSDGYLFKLENNGCSIYMSNIFYCHAPLVNGLFLLNLDRSDTHIHNIDAKRCKVDNDSATYLWHYRLGHICVKAHEETPYGWTFGIT